MASNEGTQGRLRIAILGWGSLLWDKNAEFDAWIESGWEADGPVLPIEFSRISGTRGGALTLVTDRLNGCNATTAWCLSKRGRPEDAVADLRRREGTTVENIGLLSVASPPGKPDAIGRAILGWAARKEIDAVVWTALKSNFEEKTGQPFSVPLATAYIRGLPADGKAKAAEYIRKAPGFVRTALRSALLVEPCFPGGVTEGDRGAR